MSLAISTRTGERATAEVTIADSDGEQTAVGSGDGPVDAAFAAINNLMDIPVTLVEYTISAVTGGADALGEVRIVVESHGRIFTSQAVSTDVTEASTEAYLRACAHAKAATEPEQAPTGV